MAKTIKAPAPEAAPYADPEDGSDKDYKANRAYETLLDAANHQADPGMMDRVKKVAGRKHKGILGLHATLMGSAAPDAGGDDMKPIKSIDQLRSVANSKAMAKKAKLEG
jgi:hypothetical protein